MKKSIMLVILVGFFLGLCGNTNCGPKDLQTSHIFGQGASPAFASAKNSCQDSDLDGYCWAEDFWPGFNDDGEIPAANDDQDGYAIVSLDTQSQLEVSLVTDETMLSSYNGVYTPDYNVAVMAIPLQPFQNVNWQMVEAARLDIFLLNYEEFNQPGPEYICPTSQIYASFKEAENLADMAETSCDCLNFPVCEPSGCNSPSRLGGNLKTLNFEDQGDGWFEISSPDLAALLAQTNQTGETYLVLDISSRCTSGYPFGGMKPLEIEDSGNHGSSGNVPVVSFQFNRGHYFYRDKDGDGYGVEKHAVFEDFPPDGYVAVAGDCNDHDALINPSALEIPDNKVDEDCDGLKVYEHFSLDDYDGSLNAGRNYASLVVDNTLAISEYPWYGQTTALITFDSQIIDWSKVNALGVKVFPLSQQCEYGQPKYWLTLSDMGNFYDWGGQNCSVSRSFSPWGVEYTYYPEGCIMPNSVTGVIKTWPLNKQADGWYSTDQGADVYESVLRYFSFYGEEATLFTFDINLSCDTRYYPTNSGTAEFEDGGNHGSTGNLPTLEVYYSK